MTVDELRDQLQTLLTDELGKTRRKRPAIAIVPPDFENGEIKGMGVAIQRVPVGKRDPSMLPVGEARGHDQWMRHWLVSLINFENSARSSQTLEVAKEKIEATFSGRIVGGAPNYFPPTGISKERCQFQIFDPELVEVS